MGICGGGTGICSLSSEQAGSYIAPQQWTFHNSCLNENGFYTVSGIGYKSNYWNTTMGTLNYNTNTTTMQTFYLVQNKCQLLSQSMKGTLSLINNCPSSDNYGNSQVLVIRTEPIKCTGNDADSGKCSTCPSSITRMSNYYEYPLYIILLKLLRIIKTMITNLICGH